LLWYILGGLCLEERIQFWGMRELILLQANVQCDFCNHGWCLCIPTDIKGYWTWHYSVCGPKKAYNSVSREMVAIVITWLNVFMQAEIFVGNNVAQVIVFKWAETKICILMLNCMYYLILEVCDLHPKLKSQANGKSEVYWGNKDGTDVRTILSMNLLPHYTCSYFMSI